MVNQTDTYKNYDNLPSIALEIVSKISASDNGLILKYYKTLSHGMYTRKSILLDFI